MTDIMTQLDALQKHVDDRLDDLEKHLDAADEAREKLASKIEGKQDKLPKGVMLTTLTVIFGQVILMAFLFGSADYQIQEATQDRYTGTEARKDLALRDQRDSNLETEILAHSVRLEELRLRIRELEEEVARRHPE